VNESVLLWRERGRGGPWTNNFSRPAAAAAKIARENRG